MRKINAAWEAAVHTFRAVRRLSLVAVVFVVLVLPGAAQGYGWPLRPFDRPHPVRGNFDDPRVEYGSGEHSLAFHFGIDISAPDGTPVYSVSTGTAFVHHFSVSVGTPEGLEFGYWHVIPALKQGAWVHLHELVGWIEPGWGHVHLAESRDGVYTNPLRPGGIVPYFDDTTPTIQSVEIDADGTHVDLAHVSGIVNLITEAYDTPPIAPPPPWSHSRVTPASIRWRIVGATAWRTVVVPRPHSPAAWLNLAPFAPLDWRNRPPRPRQERRIVATPWQVAVDFRHRLLPRWLFPIIYAPGTLENRAARPGRYRFYLLQGFDTRQYPDGYYQLEVEASDTRANHAISVLPFRIDNL